MTASTKNFNILRHAFTMTKLSKGKAPTQKRAEAATFRKYPKKCLLQKFCKTVRK